MAWIAFAVGLFIGALLGMFAMAIVSINGINRRNSVYLSDGTPLKRCRVCGCDAMIPVKGE